MERGTVIATADARPPRIVVGSRKEDLVYGILAKNGLLRVRTAKKWIPYEDVKLDSRIKHLSRSEVTKYCRIRQYQINQGETVNNKPKNEVTAVTQSQSSKKASTSYAVRPLLPRPRQRTKGNTELHKSKNIQRLNKVWLRQEELRQKAGMVEAKVHGQIKYERKEKGPFAGYYASNGQILCIDDEDVIEYRVLLRLT
ncbi:hypothetical protein VFPPC_16779 [Pochonia chlamydosporia 170]|uniref:Uncharacterized protein n=1 Tax=Pochonia chlamydosporia 170 TaxID=1380566 RepID=A0A179F448_METCM|nr:hypothetical protein VFPPC_16779 [Pochonia chlamydosporia 170]OAQ60186.1 hypothetical protein VFPPC_16779 [Pochonia chlamydosporia 170]